ncbi:MAG: type II toxin-antitoxin system VapC family toxin [Ignavibacteriae bacterium]|nr:type II toxin-antitoxin system VapC family toxin [Ignavibacteriota bacterium]
MNLILDTHTLLWFFRNDEQLSEVARSTIEDGSSHIDISMASFWEMAIKLSIGKLRLEKPFVEVHQRVIENGMDVRAILFEHIRVVGSLPFYHRDPFDRMIIAQALVDDLAIVSNESVFEKYGVKRIW